MFTYHIDPGHGWVEVSFHDMRASGLQPSDFSRYSYRKRNVFYLEEDCDAPKFIAAWESKHGRKVDLREVHCERTFIRNLPSIRD